MDKARKVSSSKEVLCKEQKNNDKGYVSQWSSQKIHRTCSVEAGEMQKQEEAKKNGMILTE